MSDATPEEAKKQCREWNYHPDLPIPNSPVFAWPPEPRRLAIWFKNSWFSLSERVIILGFAILTWIYFQPPLEVCKTLGIEWVSYVYARNLILMTVVTTALHLYFHTWKKQGMVKKYDPRQLAKNNGLYNFRSQLWDNVFWTLASGVTVWTAYEVLVLWAMANGYAPMLSWSEHPVLFVFLLFMIPIWSSFHFYWVHRLLHWPPLYKIAHSLHHRNVNVGPWSGLSMHPIEHIIYLSAALIHFVVASHPIHLFFNMQWAALAAATSHVGFESVVIRDKNRLNLGAFHHQLHHRYFECNYGNAEMPWDKWFGSFNDGTAAGKAMTRERLKKKIAKR
ncbi:sterol desaturase family protein [Alphaproteobacteria bacterium]|nr:sterol desaturase family protein [Alphaproteobacteria bacterium]